MMNKQIQKTPSTEVKSPKNSIGVDEKTRAKIDVLVDKVNQNRKGKRAKARHIVEIAIDKVSDSDIQELRESLTGNFDIFDEEFLKYRRKHKNISKDEFLGLICAGKVKIEKLQKRFAS